MNAQTEPRPFGRLLRMPEVERETSLDRATIYRRIAANDFPRPIRISAQRVAWPEAEIEAWKRSRQPAERG